MGMCGIDLSGKILKDIKETPTYADLIFSDFCKGLSVVGLARKYARTCAEIEEIIRIKGK